MFFADEKNAELLRRVALKIRKETESPDIFLSFIKESIGFLLNKPEISDQYCKFNIEHISKNLLNHANNWLHDEGSHYALFYSIYRFLAEFEFTIPRISDTVTELLDTIRFANDDIMNSLDGSTRTQLRYADLKMPAQILKALRDHSAIREIEKFNKSIENLNKYKKDIDKTLADKTAEANKLKEALDKYKTAFNFVGLYDGFNSLAIAKRRSVKLSVSILFTLAMLMLSPAALKLYMTIKSGNYTTETTPLNISLILSIVTIEILLLYFYRVVLHNLKSLRGQLVQLDLRRTLCQFIQEYAKYATEIKGADKELLVRFETVVFSGLVAEAGDIPSTFDGVDQLAKLVQKIKTG